jgi:hypothetical protein
MAAPVASPTIARPSRVIAGTPSGRTRIDAFVYSCASDIRTTRAESLLIHHRAVLPTPPISARLLPRMQFYARLNFSKRSLVLRSPTTQPDRSVKTKKVISHYLGAPALFQSMMLTRFQWFFRSWNSSWPSLLMISWAAGYRTPVLFLGSESLRLNSPAVKL